jgi:two-component system phosphate regulon sensor histidine kinase PhoR
VLKIEQRSLDLAELSNAVKEELLPFASKQGIKLSCEIEKTVPVKGDPVLLRQVIQNLIQNGIKYTPEGGSVEVKVSSDRSQAILKVSDTGEGIDPRDQEKIFERFFRATKSRSDLGGGSGLGLSIVKSIVDAHKGEIELTSEPGMGSTFIARLPFS